MSVTITVDGNHQYMQEHPELIQMDGPYDCDCLTNPCSHCNGSGKVSFEVYPFELNLANGNFSTLWCAFGFEPESIGSMNAKDLKLAVTHTSIGLSEKADKVEGNWISFGITKRQVETYFKRLHEITNEAIRRNKEIIWS